jgi:hypothetical protein
MKIERVSLYLHAIAHHGLSPSGKATDFDKKGSSLTGTQDMKTDYINVVG